MSFGQILGDLFILALYGFPLSFAEGWALAEPTETGRQLEERAAAQRATGDEAPAAYGEWAFLIDRLVGCWARLQGFPGGLLTGGCLTVVSLAVGVGAFALYFHLRGQPGEISQILPRFAYWFPFALLGLVTDVPFRVFAWEDKRKRAFLRLILWWFPRLVIVAFALNLPGLGDLDRAVTALVVLAVDAVLAALLWWLRARRR